MVIVYGGSIIAGLATTEHLWTNSNHDLRLDNGMDVNATAVSSAKLMMSFLIPNQRLVMM